MENNETNGVKKYRQHKTTKIEQWDEKYEENIHIHHGGYNINNLGK